MNDISMDGILLVLGPVRWTPARLLKNDVLRVHEAREPLDGGTR